MKAVIYRQYGNEAVLQYLDKEKPKPKANEVLIKIRASSINAGDWHLMTGTPYLIRMMYGGISRPKLNIIGMDIAGSIESVGEAVTQFKPGDEVFGELSGVGFGAFAEYVAVPESALQVKPENISFAEAGAIPGAALAALQGLRDKGNIQAGQKVLINGAAGGVGSMAVQIAKSFGAEVTGVCRSTQMEAVHHCGADHIIDYTKVDLTQIDKKYDLILDTAGYRSFLDYKSILASRGTYVFVGGAFNRLFRILLLGNFFSKKNGVKFKTLISVPKKADLAFIQNLLANGNLKPFIEKQFPLSQIREAFKHFKNGKKRGKVSLIMETNEP